MANQYLQPLFQKEVSRKEFLGIAGLAVLSLFGMGTIIKLLTGKSLEQDTRVDGHRGSIYGGSKERHLKS